MYFSNINDEEIQRFHGVTAPNFTIKLTDILHKTGTTFDNKLFKIEEIITDKIYKIYPMFNTVKITSSNPNDRILGNRLIIAEKTSGVTRITFISDETEDVEDYIEYGDYYKIGDTLSTAQYNSIVQLLRNNHTLTDEITIKNGLVTGEYGDYTFNIESTTIVDNGILITNETLSNIGTVTLSNPAFNNATYKLYLTVYSTEDVNIMTDETTTDITTTTLELTLTNAVPVNIPFDTTDKYAVIGFDARITILQDKPVIIFNNDWYNHGSRITVTTGTNGETILTNNNANGGFYLANWYGTTSSNLDDAKDWTAPYIAEFDIITSDKECYYQYYDGTNTKYRTSEELGLTTNNHIKVIVSDDNVIFIVDGVTNYTYNITGVSPSRFGFVVPTGKTLTFNNFKIMRG